MTEIIRLSQKAKDQLVWLKRQTGIKNWNVLCRWAFCLSLGNCNPLIDIDSSTDSNIEMSWKTFAGKHTDIYYAMIFFWLKKQNCTCGDDILEYVRKHIHRGIQQIIVGGDQSIMSLLKKVS